MPKILHNSPDTEFEELAGVFIARFAREKLEDEISSKNTKETPKKRQRNTKETPKKHQRKPNKTCVKYF